MPEIAANGTHAVAVSIVTALLSAAGFLLTRVWHAVSDMRREKARRQALISALFTEIAHNVDDLDESISGFISEDVLRRHFSSRPDASPLIVYSRNMSLFDDMRGDALGLEPDLLDKVVRFYSHLEKVYRYADSVSTPSFRGLSIDGKINVLKRLQSNTIEAAEAGRQALNAFKTHASG
jgi:hypothetical protein